MLTLMAVSPVGAEASHGGCRIVAPIQLGVADARPACAKSEGRVARMTEVVALAATRFEVLGDDAGWRSLDLPPPSRR